MTLEQFQSIIDDTYGERDAERGLERTFMWLVEEVGELARALRSESHQRKVEEFSDVLAWLTTTASLAGVDMQEAAARFERGCPKCDAKPCDCGGRRP
jgi:NTP pyrophosphatase (non-canonical NTP hydrolase)